MRSKFATAGETTEELLRTVVANVPISLFAFDRSGVITLSEGKALEDLGFKAGQLVGQSMFDIYRDAPNLEANVRSALAGETVRFVTVAEGLSFTVHFIPFREANGNLAGVLGVAHNITEQKSAEAAMRESEARKAAILDSALDCIVTMDHRGRITEFNPAAERTFGYRRHEVVGKQLADVIIPPSLRDQHRRGLARYLATGEARVMGRRVELTALHADGTEFPVELAITRIPLDGPPSFTGYLRDITERKRSEEALRSSEQVARGQVEALVQSLDVLATAPAPDEFVLRMLSTMGRLLGGNWTAVALWLVADATDSLILRAIVRGQGSDAGNSEHPFVKDPPSWKDDVGLQELFSTGVPITYEHVDSDPRIPSDLLAYFQGEGTRKILRLPTLVGGRVKGFISIRHAERLPYQPAEIELAQALAHQVMLAVQSRQAATLEERNRMARDIHDTLAQGFTAIVIQLQAAEDASAKGLKKDAAKHLQNARDLARESLTEARRSVRALRPQALEDTSFWDALKGMIKHYTAGTALHTRCRLRGRPRELPPLWQQNLLHIGQEALTNALKYAHAGRFEARLNFKEKEVRLELADDGDGFTTTDRHDGLGLLGMRERVEQMGGTISINSLRGRGTDIVVALPCEQEAS